MKRHRLGWLPIPIFLIGAALLVAQSATPAPFDTKGPSATPIIRVRYEMSDLGALPYVADDIAVGLSDSGAISFWSQTPNDTIHASIWTGGKTQDLGVLKNYASSISHGLNNQGQVVGWSVNGRNLVDSLATMHAVLFDQGQVTDLSTLGGRDSQAMGINDAGAVVGVSSMPDKTRHAFLYEHGKLSDLGLLPGGTFSAASAINKHGDIAGTAEITGQYIHAALWSGKKMIDLGTLPEGKRSRALALNNKGEVVGFSETDHAEIHAFLYKNNKMLDLGELKRDPTRANSINDREQIVGHSGVTAFAYHAFLWQEGTMEDLNKLIAETKWTLKDAYSINNRGEIICLGTIRSGESHLLLLKPVTPAAE
jgi:probable HAF family extracellular repeat protein